MAGYAFARIRFPGQNALFLVVLLGLLIPSEVTIVPLFQMFHGLGLTDTHWPLIVVPVLGAPSVLAAASMTALPVLVVFVLAQRQFIEGLAHTGLKG